MKTQTFSFLIILLGGLTLTFYSCNQQEEWIKGGSNPDSYLMEIDNAVKNHGKIVYTIKSIDEDIDGFGSMMQFDSLVGKYLGKRVRMSGVIKTEDVVDWAGLWFRIDQLDSELPLAFDNMHDRPIKGTSDWKEYEIVLDVPQEAKDFAYGVLLGGTGQLWFSSIHFEVVDNSVPTTGAFLETEQ